MFQKICEQLFTKYVWIHCRLKIYCPVNLIVIGKGKIIEIKISLLSVNSELEHLRMLQIITIYM